MPKRRSELPRSGPTREALRQKGQFWTPQWVARAMVRWALAAGSEDLYDPAVGAGAFFLAAKEIAKEEGRRMTLRGRELHAEPLAEALEHGLDPSDLSNVELADFVLQPPCEAVSAIVANPPYIRHHRLDPMTKQKLRAMSLSLFGILLDGRAGYHVYFLLRALSLLSPGGRLSFILPADVFEGVFADSLWRCIGSKFRISCVASFAPESTPFPGVDTNAMVVFIENLPPQTSATWIRILHKGTAFEDLVKKDFCRNGSASQGEVEILERALTELHEIGFSRPPRDSSEPERALGDVIRCMRGIATGDNDFFLLTDEQVRDLRLPQEAVLPVVSRTRNVSGDTLSCKEFDDLGEKGLARWMLALDGRPECKLPPEVQRYLQEGVKRGLPKKALISQRQPWYKMETRVPPPFLFAYLGRRQARFIRNTAGVVPLTGFLCVYAKPGVDLDELWKVLSSESVRDNLHRVGKSYGSGAIKVEPRALERTPVPQEMIERLVTKRQAMTLFEEGENYGESENVSGAALGP